MTVEIARAALAAAGRHQLAAETFGAWHARGLSHLDPAESVADASVRNLSRDTDPGALAVSLTASADGSTPWCGTGPMADCGGCNSSGGPTPPRCRRRAGNRRCPCISGPWSCATERVPVVLRE